LALSANLTNAGIFIPINPKFNINSSLTLTKRNSFPEIGRKNFSFYEYLILAGPFSRIVIVAGYQRLI
jgi:hypothetical protein